LLTIPADMPFLPADLLERLSRQINNLGCAMAASGDELHPVCALWDVARSLEQIDAYLASGRRSLKGFAEFIGSARSDWPGEPDDPFFNVNDLDDLAKAERRSGD
jgi:molybdopterin-guanine dinucleotide biosynthesis protein A